MSEIQQNRLFIAKDIISGKYLKYDPIKSHYFLTERLQDLEIWDIYTEKEEIPVEEFTDEYYLVFHRLSEREKRYVNSNFV